MHPLDLSVLIIYMAGIVAFGAYFSKSHQTIQDYFVSGKTIPWWAIMGSIVATETSTVTFISVPGYAYGSNLTFLQLVMGYMIGRLAVSILFIPAYFKGELLTVYQLLGERFGGPVKRLASAVFLLTRSFADGFRLFATGLVLAAVLRVMPRMDELSLGWFPSADPTYVILILSVVIIGIATIIYTYHGGMTAVIWTDVIQLVVYLVGALIAAAILLRDIPGGWAEVQAVAGPAGKFQLFDFTLGFTKSYTFWSGVIGGAFLTTATHGTDQLMVQRYFCASNEHQARKALLWSGAVVFLQFVLFLLIGTMLWVYYTQHATGEIASFMQDGRLQGDRIFPYYIVRHLPHGVVGLVLAAIFAAAMSTLSSSLNSSAAAAVNDFYVPATGGAKGDRHYLNTSRVLTGVFGMIQIAVAIAAISLSKRVVDEVLGIASFTNG
ncbi:MAG TPA: sodium:solute symporter, partial [Vicinamibacterales bacterium]